MVLGIKKDTLDDVITVLAAIILFNVIPQFKVVGVYFTKYPMILAAIAIALIAFRKRIADAIGG